MVDEVLKVADGEFRFRFADPAQGLIQGSVLELGSQGALLATKVVGGAEAYDSVLDVTIELRRGNLSRQFFAKVMAVEGEVLRIEWLTIDPGQPMRLRALMDAYRSRGAQAGRKTANMDTSGPQPAIREAGVVAPFGGGETITPFGAPQPPPSAPHKPAAGSSADVSNRAGTRRLLRPTGPAQAEATGNIQPEARDEHESHQLPAVPGDDSAQHHKVVIAPTGQFNALAKGKDVEPSSEAPTIHRPSAGSERKSPSTGTGKQVKTERIEKLDSDESKVFEGGQVRDKEGRLDIGATLRNKAKTVRASELAARHDRVRVLNLATIRGLIQEAVEESLNHLSRALDESEKKRLLEEAEEAFQEKLKAFQADKESADKKSQKLQEQLDHARKVLDDERKRTVSADQFTMSAAGLDEIEAAFRRVVDRAAVDGKIDGSLEDQLRKLAAHVLDDERQRIREKEMQAQNEKIDLLEKKIKRLATNLEDTERQRDEAREIAAALEKYAGQGMSLEQIKQKFQIGISGDDPRRDAKLKLMKELLEQNRELRKKLGIATNPAEEGEKKDGSGSSPAVGNRSTQLLAIEATPSSGVPLLPDGAAPSGEAPAVTDESAAPESNPDDQPWEPPVEEPAVNPDDLPWEPPTDTKEDDSEVDDRGVKRMKVIRDFKLPPLKK